MRSTLKVYLTVFTCLFFSSCTPVAQYPGNKAVRMIFYNEINIIVKNKTPECKYLGTLISSEGHWYSYWFTSNIDLVQGAINDMHNKANKIGANVVYINNNIDFVSSVTLVGQAYNCDIDQ